MKRNTGIKRYTPLARSTKRIPRIKPKRRSERDEYNAARIVYLRAHPFCQITLAINRISEDEILTAERRGELNNHPFGYTYFRGVKIPHAHQIHHRNKCRLARLLDERWWMSAALPGHNQVEGNKAWARETQNQLLLPMEADPDGRTPGGIQYLTTPELLAWRAAGCLP